jgi:hypothetical protein
MSYISCPVCYVLHAITSFTFSTYSGTKWRAQGRRPGEKQRHLGSFMTKEEAANAVAAHKAGSDAVTEDCYGGILVMAAGAQTAAGAADVQAVPIA